MGRAIKCGNNSTARACNNRLRQVIGNANQSPHCRSWGRAISTTVHRSRLTIERINSNTPKLVGLRQYIAALSVACEIDFGPNDEIILERPPPDWGYRWKDKFLL